MYDYSDDLLDDYRKENAQLKARIAELEALLAQYRIAERPRKKKTTHFIERFS